MHPMMAELGVVMSDWRTEKVIDLQRAGILLVEDGNHGEYGPRSGLDKIAHPGERIKKGCKIYAFLGLTLCYQTVLSVCNAM